MLDRSLALFGAERSLGEDATVATCAYKRQMSALKLPHPKFDAPYKLNFIAGFQHDADGLWRVRWSVVCAQSPSQKKSGWLLRFAFDPLRAVTMDG